MKDISEIDKNAFVTVHRAHEINGEGWTYEKKHPENKLEGNINPLWHDIAFSFYADFCIGACAAFSIFSTKMP